MTSFEQLISEARRQPFAGWDFSYLDGRWHEDRPPWDYRQIVFAKTRHARSLLDMGTGGGEFLSSLSPLPEHTCATEGYPPNLPIARGRLQPLGVEVFPVQSDDSLPFEDDTFDLVISRHESFAAPEVRRILKPGGHFITQQVGGSDNARLNELLQDRVAFAFAHWTLDYATHQLEQAGFAIIDQREAFPETVFYDIGAVVYYLKAIPWQIPGFTVEAHYDRLVAVHAIIQANGGLVVRNHRFYIEAVRPCSSEEAHLKSDP